MASHHQWTRLYRYIKTLPIENQYHRDQVIEMIGDCRQLIRDGRPHIQADFRDSFQELLNRIDEVKPPIPTIKDIVLLK